MGLESECIGLGGAVEASEVGVLGTERASTSRQSRWYLESSRYFAQMQRNVADPTTIPFLRLFQSACRAAATWNTQHGGRQQTTNYSAAAV